LVYAASGYFIPVCDVNFRRNSGIGSHSP